MLIFIFLLTLTSCVSLSPKEEENIISIPKANKEVEINNLKRAKENKTVVGEKHNLKFEFYYGPRGSYYVVIYQKDSKKEVQIDLKYFDVFLEIDKNGNNPETLMLAQEYESLYSGFGIMREGKTNYSLKLIPQDSSLGKPFLFDFKVNIGSK